MKSRGRIGLYHFLAEFRASNKVETCAEQLKRVPIPDEWRGSKWENNKNFDGPVEPILSVGDITGTEPAEPSELDRLWGRAIHELYYDLIRVPKAAILGRPKWPDAYRLGHELRVRAPEVVDGILARLHAKEKVQGNHVRGDDVESLRAHMIQCWFYELRLFEAELQFRLNHNPSVDPAYLAPQVVPFEAELIVDGLRVSISDRTRMDGLYSTRPTILELKTGEVRNEDRLAVAGYALAYESHSGVPVDLGAISYIRMRKDGLAPQIDCRIFPVDLMLRSQFIELRNTRMFEEQAKIK